MDRLAMAAQYSPSGGALVRRAIRPSRLIEREGVTAPDDLNSSKLCFEACKNWHG